MAYDHEALVKRLRDESEWTNQKPYFHAHSKCLQAADLIEQQAAEIARLREALKEAPEAVMNALWPVLGGNHMEAEMWHSINEAVRAVLGGRDE